MDSKIDKLHLAEKDFIQWLDSVEYSGNTDGYPHYGLIEGVRELIEHRISFILNWIDPEPYIIMNSRFPKAEQKLTIEQFYEWMESPVKQKDSFLQQF